MEEKDRNLVFLLLENALLFNHRLEACLDRRLNMDDLTFKQWKLLAVIATYFQSPPMIKEIAEILGTSHQNIKQITLQLEKKGLIIFKNDKKDKRILRVETTDKNKDYWETNGRNHEDFLLSLFNHLTNEEIESLNKLLCKARIHLD